MTRVGCLLAAGAVGVLLGVASRVEETTPGAAERISTERTWVLVALVAGFVAGAGRRAAVAGAVTLTAANASWYAWIALWEPRVELLTVAGSPLRWLVLGVTVGVAAGVGGAAARATCSAVARALRRRPPPRDAAPR